MLDGNAQGFFNELPPDGFLRSEEELREVWEMMVSWVGRSSDEALRLQS